ncbi:MAG: hypothetical protein ABWY56_07065, partial [Propionibacteriaceae bacterium]
MLDAAARATVSGVDDVVVFPDSALVGGFYAVSTAPRVVVGEDGRPELSLTLYGRRAQGAFHATGGLLVLTTALRVSPSDLGRVSQLLTAQLAAEWPADSREPAPTAQLLAPEWSEASVSVRLTPDLELTGSPSMAGDNRCSFSSKLTADGASALARLWRDGLPEATITYSGRLRSTGGVRGSSSGSVSQHTSSSTVVTSSSSSSHTSSSSSWGTSTSEASSWASDPMGTGTTQTHESTHQSFSDCGSEGSGSKPSVDERNRSGAEAVAPKEVPEGADRIEAVGPLAP